MNRDEQVMANDDEEVGLAAEQLYAARSALLEAKPPKHRLGVAELVQFLNDPARSLSMQEQRALFSNPKLLAAYRRLKLQVRAVEMPALAAASDAGLNARRFEGGTVRVHPSRVPGQSYMIFRFDQAGSSPKSLVLEGVTGELVKKRLPPADARGELVLVLSQDNGEDRDLLRLFCDPQSVGTFLL
jgi:hypothetical protein